MFGMQIYFPSVVCVSLGWAWPRGHHLHLVQRILSRWTADVGGELKNPRQKKKSSEKPLIPLPPTGLVSFFCAIPDVVQTNLQPRRAVGLCSRSAIAQNAKF